MRVCFIRLYHLQLALHVGKLPTAHAQSSSARLIFGLLLVAGLVRWYLLVHLTWGSGVAERDGSAHTTTPAKQDAMTEKDEHGEAGEEGVERVLREEPEVKKCAQSTAADMRGVSSS